MDASINPPEAARPSPRGGVLRRLRQDARGNTAIVFALVMVPVTLLSFGSIEFYRANSVRANLQDALDSAALVAARSGTSDATQIQNIGVAALRASLDNLPGSTLSTNTNETRFRLINGRIVADAKSNLAPWVAGYFLPQGISVTSHSEVVRGLHHVEVSMVLDVTGSMNESSSGVSKISRLRDAATALVNQLEASATASGDPNSVKIAMVPFSSSVNVGAANRSATWLVQSNGNAVANQIFTNSSGTGGTASANRFTLFTQMNVPWAGCVEGRAAPYDVQDTAASVSVPNSLYVPYFAPDEPGPGDGFTNADLQAAQNGQPYYLNDYRPDGVTGNDQYKQGNVAKYSAAPTNTSQVTILEQLGVGKYYSGPNFGCVTSPIVPLTTNFASLRTAISALTASGETNIPLGMAWGWNTLSPNGPFSTARGVAYGDPDTQKIVVLMTDGENTNLDLGNNFNHSMYSALAYLPQGRMGISSGTQDQRTTQMNSRLAALCTNLRNQGVQVYTVRVEVTSGDSSVLENCATDPTMYYDVQDASRLSDVFRSIAGSITRMRIAH